MKGRRIRRPLLFAAYLLLPLFRRRWPVHPFLFAAYPVLQLFACNAAGLRFSAPFPALAGSLVLAALAMALGWLILKNTRKAAIFASVFVWLFFSYDGFYAELKVLRLSRFHLGHAWILEIGVLWLISLSWTAYVLSRTRRGLANGTRILNATAAFLIVTCATVLLFRLLAPARVEAQTAGAVPTQARPPAAERKTASRNAPDVYLIVLDQYPRSDVLRLGFGYDNSWFLDRLRRMGFYVAEHSASNYPRTAMSLGSMLNLDYLDHLLGTVKEDNLDLGLPARVIAHNTVFTFFRDHGYRTVYLRPEFGAGNPADADVRLESGVVVSEFNQTVMKMTPVPPILEFLAPNYSNDELHRRHVRFTLESLQKLPRMGLSPFFVYAHILCPHPPIVFGENGENVRYSLDQSGRETWAMNRQARLYYVNQVAYISKEAAKVVTAVLAHSQRPPVIVLCSDHGSEFEVNWRSAEKTNMEERMANLETFYFPNGGERALYSTITNVNVFRVLFNYYFGQHYRLLPDESYFSTDDRPYRFIQVPMDAPYAPQPPHPT